MKNNFIDEELEFRTPNIGDEEACLEFIREFEQMNEKIIPNSLASVNGNYHDWLVRVEKMSQGKNLPDGYVPATIYFLICKSSGKLLGVTQIRHKLNEKLLKFGGNIGYGVAPSERRKGYADKMLKLALKKCRELGMNRVLISCDKINIGSAKTILKNGGKLENEWTDEDGVIRQRYWIEL